MIYHNPVLLQATCDYLEIIPNALYVDATYGSGGHTTEILKRGGRVLAIDQDQDALDQAPISPGLVLKKANFAYLSDLLSELKPGPIAGLIVDLGVSSHQFDTPARGFSFQSNGPLDMRMDQSLPHSAATLVNTLSEHDLARIFSLYGELPNAKSLAKKIIAARPLVTTQELTKIVSIPQVLRRLFQSLRIAVNDELGALDSLLDSINSLLTPGGRFVAISFHSLEDRAVKTAITHWVSSNLGTNLTPDPIVPSPEEQASNSRSHSAKLRAYKKHETS